MKMNCPECGEPAIKGSPVRSGWSLGVPENRMKYRHSDGEPLCPVMGQMRDGSRGYVPALPVPERRR